MADIDQIIAGGAGASSRADFSGIGKLPEAYWKGRDEFAKNDLRDAFKGGVPTDASGNIDYGAIAKTLFQKGDIAGGAGLIGATAGAQDRAMLSGIDGPQPAPQPAIVSPPSTNRGASIAVAPPLNKGGEVPQGQPQGQPGGVTPAAFLQTQGIQPGYNMEVALAAFKRAGIEPDQPFNPNDPAISSKLGPVVQRLKGVGQVQPPQPGDNPQQAQAAPAPLQASPVQVAAQNDPILKRLTFLAASPDKQTAAAAKVRLESYLKNQELTPDQKNAAASGQSLTDYQNRGDENAAQLAILKDSIIPKLDLSQKEATAARDEISAIHRSREQLDAPGGIFSGSASEVRLKIAKAAELIGVPNADKIANTEAFSAAIGSRVLALVKGLGSGTSISNSDRAFAEKMAGGNINLDETSIRKILDIGERAARSKIDMHNTNAGKIIKSNEALKGYSDVYSVEAPGQYKGSQAKQAASTFASPADVHAAIASGKLKKGDTFQDSNGKTRIVP